MCNLDRCKYQFDIVNVYVCVGISFTIFPTSKLASYMIENIPLPKSLLIVRMICNKVLLKHAITEYFDVLQATLSLFIINNVARINRPIHILDDYAVFGHNSKR